ncbi:MAG TPA: glycine dehydrogenase, partial [Acidimicrobiia bacterium]
MTRPLSELEQTDDFVRRHIGPEPDQVGKMLEVVGVASLDELVERAVPASIRGGVLDLPGPRTETAVTARLAELAGRNEVFTSMIGMGYHDTITPAVIQRNILENPGWYTAYTPYQPEISQGRLEALLNFQTMVSDLTGMEIANASMLDEATAAAEAMAMLHRTKQVDSERFLVDADCHPQTIAVLATRAEPLGIEIVVADPATATTDDVYAVLLQYPGSSGTVPDHRSLVDGLRSRGVGIAVAADLLALAMLVPPGEWGADVVVGSSQRFGVPMMFGGPHAAFFAIRDEFKRSMPGRLVGVSRDTAGRMALRLALTTREQHIRREKATSNICTAQVLLAVIAGAYGVYQGPDGLRTIAERAHRLASLLAAGLVAGGVTVVNRTWFDTLTVSVPGRAGEVVAAAAERSVNLRQVDADKVGVSVDEVTTPAHIDLVFESFGVAARVADLEDTDAGIPGPLARTSPYLTHPVFSE